VTAHDSDEEEHADGGPLQPCAKAARQELGASQGSAAARARLAAARVRVCVGVRYAVRANVRVCMGVWYAMLAKVNVCVGVWYAMLAKVNVCVGVWYAVLMNLRVCVREQDEPHVCWPSQARFAPTREGALPLIGLASGAACAAAAAAAAVHMHTCMFPGMPACLPASCKFACIGMHTQSLLCPA